MGRVRSLARRVTRSNGYPYTVRAKVLKPCPSSSGYLAVCLHNEGEDTTQPVASLVLTAFVGPQPYAKHACHKSLGRLNNSLGNLYWGARVSTALGKRIHPGKVYLRPVVRSDGVEYASVRLAAQAMKGSESAIGNCCAGTSKTSYGFGWEYADVKVLPKRGTKGLRPVIRSDGVQFESVASAGRAVGVTPGCIGRACTKPENTSGGFGWKYVDADDSEN